MCRARGRRFRGQVVWQAVCRAVRGLHDKAGADQRLEADVGYGYGGEQVAGAGAGAGREKTVVSDQMGERRRGQGGEAAKEFERFEGEAGETVGSGPGSSELEADEAVWRRRSRPPLASASAPPI